MSRTLYKQIPSSETDDENGNSEKRGHNLWKMDLEMGPVKDNQHMLFRNPNVTDTRPRRKGVLDNHKLLHEKA